LEDCDAPPAPAPGRAAAVPTTTTAKVTTPPPPPSLPCVPLSLHLEHCLGVGSLEGCRSCSGGGGGGDGGSGEAAGTRVVLVAAARVLEGMWWWWCWWFRWWWCWCWQPLSRVVQRCDGDAPVLPPPTARRRLQRPSGRTTAATAETPGLMGAQVGPHLRPNWLRAHLFVLHLLTEACSARLGEEVGFAAAGDGLA
jgi:hypothetical protein